MITFKQHLQEQQANIISMDIPLFMRILEYAREDASDDLDLHFVTENVIRLSSTKPLTMADYRDIVKINK